MIDSRILHPRPSNAKKSCPDNSPNYSAVQGQVWGESMKVLVSGSHGLVGKALTKLLSDEGHEVCRLVRRERAVGSCEINWHPNRGTIDAEQLGGFEAVVHLAGESIASGRWTEAKKRAIRESRVKGTRLLSESLAGLSSPPATLVSASAIGFYGDRDDEVLTEQSGPGKDFLASVCQEWEAATQPAAEKGIRVVKTRFGIILDSQEGALAKMIPPFRMGVGGKVGDGRQWMSWIALEDVVNALSFVLNHSSIKGPVNFVAPTPVRNAEFTRDLGKILSRPTFFPIPSFGARLVFGEMADALLLSSQKVAPRVLEKAGYRFAYPTLPAALKHTLAKK